MVSTNHSGYTASCKSIVTCAQTITKAIKEEISELYVLGEPPASVVAFASKHPRVSVHAVGDKMSERGWHLNGLSNPAAVHIACTVSHPLPPFQFGLCLPFCDAAAPCCFTDTDGNIWTVCGYGLGCGSGMHSIADERQGCNL